MTPIQIIANVLSFIGNSFFTFSAILKSKTKIIIFQSFNYIFAIVSEALVGAFPALVQESVSLIRNIIFIFVKQEKKILRTVISISCLVVATVLGIVLNIVISDNVWYGYLPVAGAVTYSTVVIIAFLVKMDALNAELIIKSGLLINSILWAIYGFYAGLYTISFFNIVNVILCVISIIRVFINKKQIKEEKEKGDVIA